MSERWTSESFSQFEFYLELQTLVLYYEDCFSRLSFPYPKPMPSVTHCIELLKVASQIQCQELVDLGMKHLASVPWTGDQEKEIREFCNSGYFAAVSAGDLKARLNLPSNVASDVPSMVDEETHVNYTDLAKKTLNRHLDFALCPYLTGSESPTGCESIIEVVDSRKLFAEAFHCIMSEADSNMCHTLREYFMTLVKEEAEKILVNIVKNEMLVGYDAHFGEEIVGEDTVEEEVSKLYWLYDLLRGEKVSQVLVDLILKNEKVDMRLKSANCEAQCKWAGMMVRIFEDLLEGDLFLNASERYSLFMEWKWMLNEEYLEDDETYLVELITSIVRTFPPLQQEEVYLSWVVTHGNNRILAKSYSKWIKHLIREAAKREPNLEEIRCADPSIADVARQ